MLISGISCYLMNDLIVAYLWIRTSKGVIHWIEKVDYLYAWTLYWINNILEIS